jgi:hypothetical protein
MLIVTDAEFHIHALYSECHYADIFILFSCLKSDILFNSEIKNCKAFPSYFLSQKD